MEVTRLSWDCSNSGSSSSNSSSSGHGLESMVSLIGVVAGYVESIVRPSIIVLQYSQLAVSVIHIISHSAHGVLMWQSALS